MKKEKRYKLLKDSISPLQLVIAGTIHSESEWLDIFDLKETYFIGNYYDEWFREVIEEKPFVVNFYGEGNTKINFKYMLYNDFTDKEFIISKERLQEILIAENKGELFINGNEQVWLRFGKEKLYTEKEWLQFGEECFEAARKNNSEWYFKYKNFSDYMNIKNEVSEK